ncbi:hypothetical protein E4U41_000475 [Claviceps citrina]|nr:hypothetical protein E4U41_000475 [Claviceps citrina]
MEPCVLGALTITVFVHAVAAAPRCGVGHSRGFVAAEFTVETLAFLVAGAIELLARGPMAVTILFPSPETAMRHVVMLAGVASEDTSRERMSGTVLATRAAIRAHACLWEK